MRIDRSFTVLLSLWWVFATFALPHAHAEDLDPERKAELEAEFEKTLSGSQLVGYFTMDGVDSDQPLNKETYTISKVTKFGRDLWRFDARIQYGSVDATVPIPLSVKWAGDTPVITLTDMSIPGVGTYTARVLIYRNQYAGTWSGRNYGGQMFGRIVRAPETEEKKPAENTDQSDGEGAEKTSIRTNVDAAQNWPQFRGPGASGIQEGFETPAEFSVPFEENIAWSTTIPGLAHSAPVIWGDRVYVTTAVRKDGKEAPLKVGLYGSIEPVPEDVMHDFILMCIDKASGKVLWKQTACEAVPKIKRHPKGSHAASSPATDGKHVVAMFASEGLYCYDTEGKLLWKKDLGTLDSGFFMVPTAQWGFASSPVIHDGKLILQVDVQGQSYVALYDVATGAELWKTKREETPGWSTPTVYEHDGTKRIALNGWKHIGGYDFATGKEVWKLVGGGDLPTPTPVIGHDHIYLTSAHGMMAPIYAIPTSAKGELANTDETKDMTWRYARGGNYMQTPLVYGDHLYCCADNGVLTCYEAKTGKEVYKNRIGRGSGGFSASAVAADGKLYFTSERGAVYVIEAGPEFKKVSVNDLGETCMASPAISEGTIFFRTRSQLLAARIMPKKDE